MSTPTISIPLLAQLDVYKRQYLNRYYSDVLGWTDTAKFGIFSAVLPMVSVIFVILGNLLVCLLYTSRCV